MSKSFRWRYPAKVDTKSTCRGRILQRTPQGLLTKTHNRFKGPSRTDGRRVDCPCMKFNIFLRRENFSFRASRRREAGATAVEYSLLVGLIAVGSITSTVFLKTQMASAFTKAGDVLEGAVGGSTSSASSKSTEEDPVCVVTYGRDWEMGGSFGAFVHVENLGGPVKEWNLTWSLQKGETLVGAYSAKIKVDGTAMSAYPEEWNALSLATGETVKFGYGIDNSVKPITPSDFALNGAPCLTK